MTANGALDGAAIAKLTRDARHMRSLREQLPELHALEGLIAGLRGARVSVLGYAEHRGESLPLYCVGFGPVERSHPTLLFVGGVHGLERVGSQVLLNHLAAFKAAAAWDDMHRQCLERVRVFFIPIVNPVGMVLGTRANGAGVDLMGSGDAGGC